MQTDAIKCSPYQTCSVRIYFDWANKNFIRIHQIWSIWIWFFLHRESVWNNVYSYNSILSSFLHFCFFKFHYYTWETYEKTHVTTSDHWKIPFSKIFFPSRFANRISIFFENKIETFMNKKEVSLELHDWPITEGKNNPLLMI
jgi:hypothetical protein